MSNWRNFSRADVGLRKRVFLAGPNASGKSNFLDVFRFLHDLVAVGGGFQEAVLKRRGVSSLRCYAARRYPDISIQADIGTDENLEIWKYELDFSQDNNRRPFIKREAVYRAGTKILDRPNEEDTRDPARLRQTYLEQVNVNREFRDISDFFLSVRYLHLVPQLVRDPDRSVGRHGDPYGGDFLEQIASTSDKTRVARLRRILDAMRVAVPQLKTLELWRDVRGTPHLRGRYQHWRAHGAWQTEDQFSDGTLRLMGLLWAVMGGPGVLLLEEPELSLHPEVVQHIPQMLVRVQRRSGAQVMISTHSGDLLRDEGIGLDEALLLIPGAEGTTVKPAAEFQQIKALLEGGSNLADAVLPQTRPANAQQLIFKMGD
ncbi:AAA family ATPase [Candidatus Binatus sp.]|uniref:AAA family ATPase n=1 Tax=Candidatus Binatus sp. TaxID=2811406 RepID=UPI00351D094A